MDDSLGDTLPVEVGQLLHQGGVGEQDGPARPGGQRVELVAHGGAIGQGEPLLVLEHSNTSELRPAAG